MIVSVCEEQEHPSRQHSSPVFLPETPFLAFWGKRCQSFLFWQEIPHIL